MSVTLRNAPGFLQIFPSSSKYYLPMTQPGIASVTLWHGYHALPDDVKILAYELAQQAMVVSHGKVKQLATPGEYRIEPTQDFGLSLNKDQMNRLGSDRANRLLRSDHIAILSRSLCVNSAHRAAMIAATASTRHATRLSGCSDKTALNKDQQMSSY